MGLAQPHSLPDGRRIDEKDKYNQLGPSDFEVSKSSSGGVYPRPNRTARCSDLLIEIGRSMTASGFSLKVLDTFDRNEYGLPECWSPEWKTGTPSIHYSIAPSLQYSGISLRLMAWTTRKLFHSG